MSLELRKVLDPQLWKELACPGLVRYASNSACEPGAKEGAGSSTLEGASMSSKCDQT